MATTRGIEVRVTPTFVPEQSGINEAWQGQRYVFSYHIHLSNNGQIPVKLLSRHWTIVDADGESHEVRGEGVVGVQPELAVGESFEYSSFCPLSTPWGTMEGAYLMEAEGGEQFEIKVGRFYLVCE